MAQCRHHLLLMVYCCTAAGESHGEAFAVLIDVALHHYLRVQQADHQVVYQISSYKLYLVGKEEPTNLLRFVLALNVMLGRSLHNHDKCTLGCHHELENAWINRLLVNIDANTVDDIQNRQTVSATQTREVPKPPGALPSSLLGYEALTGSLDDSGFEDYLHRLNQDCEHLVLLRQFCGQTTASD
ncbi:Cyclin-B1-2 [Zea mays]|uniref:Cyclin-B1-2 n=1 Tax=Zea mays TaxID=4577 RepID=A0A3L6DH06_MAIZE|nr:Cyclin-B1-2 [Zea mays]